MNVKLQERGQEYSMADSQRVNSKRRCNVKKYQKPEIKKVKLVLEEAVLSLCKRIPNGSNTGRCDCSVNRQNYS